VSTSKEKETKHTQTKYNIIIKIKIILLVLSQQLQEPITEIAQWNIKIYKRQYTHAGQIHT
jgi:hypothetical protein